MKYIFNAMEIRDKAVDWIKNQSEAFDFDKVVIGISGGKDSAVAAALCCRALGSDNVHGLILPNGIQSDFDDAERVCKALNIEYTVINLKPIYDTMLLQYAFAVADSSDNSLIQAIADESYNSFENKAFENLDKNEKFRGILTEQAKINLTPRIRMTMIRLYGQSHHARVCGTSNLSEIILGYYTKDGDNRCDFNPLGELTSIEVVEIGKTLNELPIDIVEKEPADGLTGKTDEENTGIKYIDVHKYARNLDMDKSLWYDIHEIELKNLHKRAVNTFTPKVKYSE